MDKEALNKKLELLKNRFSGVFSFLSKNKQLTAIIACVLAALIILLCVIGNSCAVGSEKKKAPEITTDEPTSSLYNFIEPSTSDSAAAVVASDGTGRYKVYLEDVDELNMRLIPSSTSYKAEIVTTIPNETEIEILFVYEGWGFTEYNDCSGWVFMEYLAPVD